MWNLKQNKINEQRKEKQTHRYREHADGCQRRGGEGIETRKLKKYKFLLTEGHR